MIHRFPNMLIVAGTGRNVGKTSFVCEMIERFAKAQKVIAIKISPHFHQISESEKLIKQTNDFEIIEELEPLSSKDSSRMLKAGANRVFYVQTKTDKALPEVIKNLEYFWTKDVAVVCESGGLRRFVDPGLFVVCRSDQQTEIKPHLKKLESVVDQFILFQDAKFNFDLSRIEFENGKWIVKSE